MPFYQGDIKRKKGHGSVWHKEYRYFKPAFLMEKRIKTLTRKQKKMLVSGRPLKKVLEKAGK